MKKSIFALAALAALALTACQKEEQATFLKSFKASTERYTQQGTKTELAPDGHNIYWQDGDEVMVRGYFDGVERFARYQVIPEASNPIIADMQFSNGYEFPSLGDVEYIIYPSSLVNEDLGITFPGEQLSETGGIAGLPMAGVYSSDDQAVRFYHMFGLLKLNLTKADVTVDHISITTELAINGGFATDFSNASLMIDDQAISYPISGNLRSDATTTTTLQLSTPQDISTAKDFYIGIPQGVFNTFVIRIYTDDGRVATMSATSAITIERAKITSVTAGGSLAFRDVD